MWLSTTYNDVAFAAAKTKVAINFHYRMIEEIDSSVERYK